MERVIFWWFLLEEYRPAIRYIKGIDNDEPDSLIIIPLINSYVTGGEITRGTLAESYFINKLHGGIFPLTYKIIDKYQYTYK